MRPSQRFTTGALLALIAGVWACGPSAETNEVEFRIPVEVADVETGNVEDLLGISVENTSAVTQIRQNAESIAENSEATGASSRVAEEEADKVVEAVNPVPVTVTLSPPRGVPLLGDTAVMVGAAL